MNESLHSNKRANEAAKGISLHVGMKEVDTNHYYGWNGLLKNSESDAAAMHGIAKAQGFEATLLLTSAAIRDAVRAGIRSAARQCKPGDIFLFTFAGHGGRVENPPDSDEDELMDSTLCLYDGQLLDDELGELWTLFQEGVKILVFSDSCHSGTVTRDMDGNETEEQGRSMPATAEVETYDKNQEFYDAIQSNLKKGDGEILAAVRLIAACQDDQVALEHKQVAHGLFTGTLVEVWEAGIALDNYESFYQAIADKMPERQRPNHYVIGKSDEAFDASRPFAIG